MDDSQKNTKNKEKTGASNKKTKKVVEAKTNKAAVKKETAAKQTKKLESKTSKVKEEAKPKATKKAVTKKKTTAKKTTNDVTKIIDATAVINEFKEIKTEKKKKIALVLEGGGMRGTYTAGCLSWLLDEGIKFDGAYGISSGAVHLTSFLQGKKNWLYDMSTNYIPEKSSIGLGGFLKEGQVCAFDYKFANAKKHLGFTIEGIKTDVDAKIGLYDLNIGKVEYYPVEEMNDEMLKASCSLPILSVTRKVNGHEYLDAGITDMIPIEKAVNDGYDGYLIITTKAKDYVRKKTNTVVVNLMKLKYLRCQNIAKDYAVRAENYYKQINMIKELEGDSKAIYRYPSENMTNITRFGGEVEDLKELFELGRKDMEAIKDKIYELFK